MNEKSLLAGFRNFENFEKKKAKRRPKKLLGRLFAFFFPQNFQNF